LFVIFIENIVRVLLFCNFPSSEIITKLQFPSPTPFRPGIGEFLEEDQWLLSVMHSCLEEAAEKRPTFTNIEKEAKRR
jgi:hypothetical protein